MPFSWRIKDLLDDLWEHTFQREGDCLLIYFFFWMLLNNEPEMHKIMAWFEYFRNHWNPGIYTRTHAHAHAPVFKIYSKTLH